MLPGGRQHIGSSGSGGGVAGGPGGGAAGGGGPSGAGGSAGENTSGGGTSGGGAGASGTAGGESASSTGSASEGTPSDPSSIHSENGFGSSSQVPGVSPAAVSIGAGVPAAHTAGSTLPSYLLMLLIGAAAIAVGLIVSRGRGASK